MAALWLKPGDIFFGKGNYVVKTVLGSGVAGVLWHPQLKMVGVCHVEHPSPRRSKDKGCRFADNAVLYFVEKAFQCGSVPSEYVVDLIGGADIDDGTSGEENIRRMECLLVNAGFYVRRKDTGGSVARNIKLNVKTGELQVSYVMTGFEMSSYAKN